VGRPLCRAVAARLAAHAGRLATIAALSLAGLGVCSPSAGAAEAGLNIGGLSPAQLSGVDAIGAHWARLFLSWRAVEPARGQLNPGSLASYEQVFRQLPAGTRVILDVVDTPAWETGSGNELTPPANPQDYAAFVATLARRFAPWVAAYEVWNEEDEARWWAGGPDPVAYAQLLKAVYPAVKSAEPRAKVVLGGLTGNDFPFLEEVYRAGAKGSFDAVGVHTDTACNVLSPYDFLRGSDNRMIPDSFLAYREVHAVMLANGDDKPIWMTEMSWRTTSAVCSEGAWAGQKPAGVSDAAQALYLEQAYHCLAGDPYVQVALWFPLQDQGAVTSGLLRADGSRKPSYVAMRDYTHSGDRVKGSCGVFTGPRITVSSPSDHIRYSGPLSIRVSARSSQGVFRIRLEIDGKLIRNYDGKADPSYLAGRLTWQGAKHISLGHHTLTFLAYDKERNISRRSITIVHTAAVSRYRRHH
jgi:hypothetical protein